MRIILFYTLLSFNCLVLAQHNLIINSSFEYYYKCDSIFHPDSFDYSNLPNDMFLPKWEALLESPDLFFNCSPLIIGNIPQNVFGYQYANTGKRYVGIATFGGYKDAREYFGQSIKKLEPISYCFTMYVSKSDSARYATSKFCVLFSDSIIHWQSFKVYNTDSSGIFNFYPFRYTPQLVITELVTDELSWTKISGTYKATGNEKYIVIGNMFNDNECGVTYTSNVPYNPNSGLNFAYYYIDDISLTPLTPANGGRDTTICLGDSIQIGMPYWDGLEYEWQAAQGLRNTSIANPWVMPTQTISYNLTLHQCQDTYDAVTITVQDCKAEPIVNLPTLLKLKDVLSIKNLPANSTVSIYNTSGQLVKEFNNYQNNQTLTIAEGIYILKLSTDNGFRKVGKLVLVVE